MIYTELKSEYDDLGKFFINIERLGSIHENEDGTSIIYVDGICHSLDVDSTKKVFLYIAQYRGYLEV